MMRWFCLLADRARQRARRENWTVEQVTGRRGEDLAHRYLEGQGFTIVARNWRPPAGSGEIDLVGWQGDTLVFIEVKSRQSDEFGAPDRNVDYQKRRSVVRAGLDYARRAEIPWDRVRFDLVTVVFSERPQITHTPQAFAIRAGG